MFSTAKYCEVYPPEDKDEIRRLRGENSRLYKRLDDVMRENKRLNMQNKLLRHSRNNAQDLIAFLMEDAAANVIPKSIDEYKRNVTE